MEGISYRKGVVRVLRVGYYQMRVEIGHGGCEDFPR